MLTVISSLANHIVGGDIRVEYVSGTNYKFIMNAYFDTDNGLITGATQKITIYQKSNNTRIADFDLNLQSNSNVTFNPSICTNATQAPRTTVLVYEATHDMATYTDPGGYYAVIQNYARNTGITNLSGTSGLTFYMEFPEEGLKNSSPEPLVPLNDYACVNKDFSFSFAVTDPDGDDIVYSLVAPLDAPNGTNDGTSVAAAGPYSDVTFAPGFSVANMIPGTPSLSINTNGLLTLKATNIGLYSFAVLIEEFRGGVKIGEVRRDFQLIR